MAKKQAVSAQDLRGQIMLQIAAGRFFRQGADLNETEQRFTVYSNAWFVRQGPVRLPVGQVIPSSQMGGITSAMITAVDALETNRRDDSTIAPIATDGTHLVDDIAYVITFVLNRTVSRNYDQTRRLVLAHDQPRGRAAKDLFPGLFEPDQVIRPDEWDGVRQFMEDLLALPRGDFARVMRAIRSGVNATRRAVDDPTGAYTDLVAALESLAEDGETTPTSWDRYDGRKRKMIDTALVDAPSDVANRVRQAVLEADRAGLKRRFVSSTLARLDPSYYRVEAANARRPPRGPDMERLLRTAYDIRSRHSHVLQDLGEEAWLLNHGAETAYQPRTEQVLTLAGLWRILRHVVRRYVADTAKVTPEPWDYRMALPGYVNCRLAPQLWVHQAEGLHEGTAAEYLNGFAEALIGRIAGEHNDGLAADTVSQRIESLVPHLPDGDARTALIALHALWNSWVNPDERRQDALDFLDTHIHHLHRPSPSAFVVMLLASRPLPAGEPLDLDIWDDDEWIQMATDRHQARLTGAHAPLPAKIDALLQLEAADRAEAAGNHPQALAFAARAVEEVPGDRTLLAWEDRLRSGVHDPDFSPHTFLFGKRTDATADDHTSPEDEQHFQEADL